MACALGWALRDHRRRLLELASEEQEDRLYMTVLGIVFCVCCMGAYFSFNRAQLDPTSGYTTRNILVAEIQKLIAAAMEATGPQFKTPVPYAPDAQIRVPIPGPRKLDEELKLRKSEGEGEYNSLAVMFLISVTVFAAWYFYPRHRPNISPPRDYMDQQDMNVGEALHKSTKPSH